MMKTYKELFLCITVVSLFILFGCSNNADQFNGNNPKSGYVEIDAENLLAISEEVGSLTLPVNLNTSTNPNGVAVSYTIEAVNGTLPTGFNDISNGHVIIEQGKDIGFIELAIPDSDQEYSFKVSLTQVDDTDFSIGLDGDSKVTNTTVFVGLKDTIQITIDENPDENQVLASLASNFITGTTFSIESESVPGSMAVDETTGELSVLDRFAFDREANPVLTASVNINVGNTSITKNIEVTLNDITIIWSGPMVTFTKLDGSNWNLPENQDRITDDVWITRQNRWSIFNIAQGDLTSRIRCNDNSVDGSRPLLTRWARGNTSDLESLTFTPFFNGYVCGPGVNLPFNQESVLEIYGEDIFIDLVWLSWSNRGAGGFSYMRSTP
ncbi:hypothetical protein Q4Q34_09525 [Flavivirga abyssicola]|uniref:hypothetical protein n=1 Tax=Flavivirga abyssicola TaxID=3063533 RepID=UPI0026DFF73A|nr:hypothetical protein [Flavivirga sp. MEBiC07777]WVK15266.1 hypothetical protein Q4Q34_09525 [Flavivirga sp. MEBiC07777]